MTESVAKVKCKVEKVKINFDDFDVIKPVTRKKVKQVVTISNKGDFSINNELRKVIKTSKFEVRIKKDCSQILLLPDGKEITDVGNHNRMKNYAALEKLMSKKIKLPAYYVGNWSDENGCWIGELVLSNPNRTGKKVIK